MSIPIRMSLIIIIFNLLFSSILGVLYYDYEHKSLEVQENIGQTKIYLSVKEEYLESPRARLVNTLYDDNSWQDAIYNSIVEAPLVITSSEIHDNELHLELTGRSQDFITWLNKVNEYILSCTVRIVSVHTKGNAIIFHCVITPRKLSIQKHT